MLQRLGGRLTADAFYGVVLAEEEAGALDQERAHQRCEQEHDQQSRAASSRLPSGALALFAISACGRSASFSSPVSLGRDVELGLAHFLVAHKAQAVGAVRPTVPDEFDVHVVEADLERTEKTCLRLALANWFDQGR